MAVHIGRRRGGRTDLPSNHHSIVFARRQAAGQLFERGAGASQQTDDAIAERAPTTMEILRSPAFWLLFLSVEPGALVSGAIVANLLPFYHDLGQSLQHASYVLAAQSAAAALGAVVGGYIVDRVAPTSVLMAIAVMGMLGLSGLASGLVPPAICLCFTYFGLGGIGACYGVAARTYFGAAGYAPTMGMLGPFMMASSFAGAGAGWLRDQFGNYHIVF